ncbi:MAG: protein kinase [Acidobacteria bacterium]|nr:protein kinase [Acidobacteriota bacterium]
MPIQIGDILGDYQVTGVLGRGGMGKVFRVRSLLTDREEAMKVVLPDLAEDPGLADRFLREIKVHASLQHPNICGLRAALRVEGRLIMIVELVEGESLEDRMRPGPMDAAAAVRCAIQVLSALGYAHERGVIHRDIKPANILIARTGEAKLTDFGIARSEGTERLTGTGLAVGTLAYMSPEQIRAEPVDGRSDLYSFGLTLYEMVTGRRAIHAESQHALMTAQLEMLPAEPVSVNPYVPAAVSAAIMRAVQKDPARRFQTAREFEDALRHLGGGAMPAAPEAASATRTLAVSPPELAELEARLSRIVGPIARRMVPDAARRYGTISEIRRALAEQIADPGEREAFLKASGGPATPAPAPAAAGTPAPGHFDPAALERVTQALAPHLGPIAKVLVSRTARASRTPEDLLQSLSAEIASADDRRKFLAAARSAF